MERAVVWFSLAFGLYLVGHLVAAFLSGSLPTGT